VRQISRRYQDGKVIKYQAAITLVLLIALQACSPPETPATPTPLPSRESRIPAEAVKQTSNEDPLPPVLHNPAWEDPLPMPGPINTAGGEDAPFITPDGETFLFFFTPDTNIPAQQQFTDGVTGIYQSRLVNGRWTTPQKLILSKKAALDGCPFLREERLWFCTVREGATGVHWFTAEWENSSWKNWQPANFDPAHRVGELHISPDGERLYYHSDRPGGLGKNDLWMLSKSADGWHNPENISAVNSPEDDSRPFLSPDGLELWFTRSYQGSPAVFRSHQVEGTWQEPELIISQFAGEPTLDSAGNLYFVHHFVQNGVIIEADIYLARKK
jgi:hypothetical protein